MTLVDKVYTATEKFPADQRYGLTQQIQRCAVSIPSNIAEGSARNSKKEFVQFLYIARGSIAELETQLIIAQSRKYLSTDNYIELSSIIESINRMLGKLIQSQKTNDQ